MSTGNKSKVVKKRIVKVNIPDYVLVDRIDEIIYNPNTWNKDGIFREDERTNSTRTWER